MVGQPCVLLVLLLILLGCGLQSRSLAQVNSNDYALLPVEEMLAIRTVIEELGSTLYITRSSCSWGASFLFATSVVCKRFNDSVYNNGSVTSVYHITAIDFSQSNSKLQGYIHEDVGKLSYLTKLDLSYNQLNGTIPDSLGNLKNLTILNLQWNFLSGNISFLGKLKYLEQVDLWSNWLSGQIPPDLGYLSNLWLLRLDDNKLSGELPPQLGNLKNLQQFWVTSNNLTGKLPQEYAQLTNLVGFGVGGNNLSGPIDPFIAKWVNLTTLNLMGNNFEGTLPEKIFQMGTLRTLWVSDLNNTGFSLPNSTNFKEMEDLILRNCAITGPIPEYIGNWSELTNLDLSFNKLTGVIPPSFHNLSLEKIFLTGNMLNGALADTINYDNLEKADLSYNNFKFPKPDRNLSLPDPSKMNVEPETWNFTNKIMDERCPHRKSKKPKYSSLFINAGSEATDFEGNHYDADESNSSFYDSQRNWAYSCTGDFIYPTTNLSDYIKDIPCGVSASKAALYAKPRLCPQSLTYYGFCLRNGNYTVQLHFAETIYARDEDHSITGKRVFDIYIQRNLERKDFNIKEKAGGPHTPLVENFTAINVHDHLLEIGLFWAGKGSLYNPPNFNGPLISAISVKPEFRVGGLSSAKIAGITVGAIFIPLLLLIFMWRMGWLGHKEFQETLELRGKTYTAKQVIDATRNFSHKLEIGKGRFGIVYKAELPDQTVAVKRLSSQSKQVIDQLGREVYTLKTVKHQNLLEFLDVYTKKDLHMLIYEYMEHRSLAYALFDSNSNLELNWDTRFNICLGIARGLKYLHEDSRLKIIHRNIKPSNILLDGELNAKVSDFGLAKLYEGENLNVVIGAGDTLVYMAPEYATANVITEKADVYSFGIVLLEIVSGKKNADYRPNQETVYLIDDACVLHSKGKLVNLIDEKLQTYDRKQALDVLNIAILCIDRSPTLRPTMSEVVSVLEGNKKIEELSKAATSST